MVLQSHFSIELSLSENDNDLDIPLQKIIFWRKRYPRNFYLHAITFSTFTFFYFLSQSKSPRVVTISKFNHFVVCMLIMVVLPLIKLDFSDRARRAWWFGLTATITIVCILTMESLEGRQQSCATYLGVAVIYRLFVNKTVFDNLALCIAYSADVSALNNDAQDWFVISRLYIWGSFVLVQIIRYLFRKVCYRIWEHIRVVLIYREKSKKESDIAKKLLESHIVEDPTGRGTSVSLKSQIDVVDSVVGSSVTHNEGDELDQNPEEDRKVKLRREIVEAATKADILAPFSDVRVEVDRVKSFEGVKMRPSAVIAFKQNVDDERGVVLSGACDFSFHDVLDNLAKNHRISCVRRFGDVWIGLVGSKQTWGSHGSDCYHAIQMACEVMVTAEKRQWSVACAIDHGAVVGGFIGNPAFDIFGPEVRWVLTHVEMKKVQEVLVSSSVKQLISRRKETDEKEVTFHKVLTDPIVRSTGEDKVVLNHFRNQACL